MDEIEKILKTFLAECTYPESYSGPFPTPEDQRALNRARKKFEKILLKRYGTLTNFETFFPKIPGNTRPIEGFPCKADELINDLIKKHSDEPKGNNRAS